MKIFGDYRYGSVAVNGEKYAVIKENDIVTRIRIIGPVYNRIIWRAGDILTPDIINMIDNAVYVPEYDINKLSG